MILSGSAHPKLAQKLGNLTGMPLAKVAISKFPNGEKRILVKDKLEGKPVIIVQPFCEPVDEHIIEFCLLQDAAHHLQAKTIIGVIPWLGYSPQDKLFRAGEPISAHVVARLITSAKLDELVVIDIHSQAALAHFSVPTVHLSAVDLFADFISRQGTKSSVVAALDQGSVNRNRELAERLKLPLVKLKKVRHQATGQVTFTGFEGKVKDKHVVAFDDFVSTGGTLIHAAKLLKRQGALTVTVCVTHALLNQNAAAKLQASSLDKLIVTDSYPIPLSKRFAKLTVLSIAPLIANYLTGKV